ncbi:protein of unknown function [Paraburkholderia dioscoreae]|uniref:Uncharacterized protein n=1 Tax=Paraburkholderia dioscoreae TaxID=2604047 RepID=A0A5Q4ZFV9_9BURK|nr:protein of unknown function [Paraburkholderia dioscoreae]
MSVNRTFCLTLSTQEQLAGLVVGLPWQRIGADGVIRVI